jgi:hypothetical protein
MPPDFWDFAIFRICQGLSEGHVSGSNAACGVLREARRKGLFTVDATLDDLSVLLLVLHAPSDTRLGNEAVDELYSSCRNLSRADLWNALRDALPPYLADFHALTARGGKSQRGVLRRILRYLYYPELVVFLDRLALVDRQDARNVADPLFDATLENFTPIVPSAMQPATLQDAFLVKLYRATLDRGWPAVNRWPASLPDWAEDGLSLSTEEHHFLDVCLEKLDPGDRLLLYLSFYARLSIRQIHLVLGGNRATLQPKDFVSMLARVWTEVVRTW